MSPGPATNDYDARIATYGERLWLAKTNRTKGGAFSSRVFEFRGDSWVPLPGEFESTLDSQLELAGVSSPGPDESAPCVGYTSPKGIGQVQCFRDARWKPVNLPKRLRSYLLAGLVSQHGVLTALLVSSDASSTSVQVASSERRADRLEPVGPPISLKGQVLANLGEPTSASSASPIDVGFENIKTGQRWVATLHSSGWSHTDLLTRPAGPQTSGPARTSDSLFIPVVNAITDGGPDRDWPFSVYRHQKNRWNQLGGKSVSSGIGDAQGTTGLVGDRSSS